MAQQVFARIDDEADDGSNALVYTKPDSNTGEPKVAKSAIGPSEESAVAVEAANQSLLVCLDARKAQVYCALYERDELGRPRRVSSEAVLDPSEVLSQFKGRATVGAGMGFSVYPEPAELNIGVYPTVQPSARAIALRAASGVVVFEEPYLATPTYVRDNVTHGS